MINKAIIKAVIDSATKENKDKVLNELFNHMFMNYDYDDSKSAHILEMLVDNNSIITSKDININYINEHLNLLIYNSEKFNIRNIKLDSIDNINGYLKITYEYLEKVNEDRDDIDYISSYTNVSFIDNPNILKK